MRPRNDAGRAVGRRGHVLNLMDETLGTLQTRYEHLLHRLLPDTPASVFHQRIQTHPTHNGDAHVELVDSQFHYVVTERGTELERRVARDSDEVLYWLIDDATRSMRYTSGTSLLHRLLGKDPRRQRFARHLHLLERVNPEWAERKRAYYSDLLERYPYRDKAW